MYFGTTGGQVYTSADAGDTWAPIVRDLPAVLSVEVQTLFFACQEDLSHDAPDAPLPEAVTTGAEPYLIVGAMADGCRAREAWAGCARLDRQSAQGGPRGETQ